jgi:hypothetical protein
VRDTETDVEPDAISLIVKDDVADDENENETVIECETVRDEVEEELYGNV